jgi:hypothetical protein
MGPKKSKKTKGNKDEAKEETEGANEKEQSEWKALKTDADRLHKATQKEEHDFNEFQQQREKLNYFWILIQKVFVTSFIIMIYDDKLVISI